MFRAAVLVLSDKGSVGEREDISGRLICECLKKHNYLLDDYDILPDNYSSIVDKLKYLCDVKAVNLVITTGGTGFAKRDITPEATAAVAERLVPGISEAIRAYSITKTKRAMLSRGISVLRGNTLIINLPGSPKAVTESMEVFIDIIDHGLGVLTGREGECGNG